MHTIYRDQPFKPSITKNVGCRNQQSRKHANRISYEILNQNKILELNFCTISNHKSTPNGQNWELKNYMLIESTNEFCEKKW